MTLPVEVAGYLADLGLGWVNGIYPVAIPQELQADTAHTIILVTEVENTPSEFNNNTFSALFQTVQVQIFYAMDFSISTDDVEVFLMKKFASDGWTIAVSEPRDIDPDTKQMFKTLQFSRNKRV